MKATASGQRERLVIVGNGMVGHHCVEQLVERGALERFELHVFGVPLDAGRMPVYTIGFFFFWALGASAAALTVFLQRSPVEVNRCPLGADDRPPGCPKRPGAQDVAG